MTPRRRPRRLAAAAALAAVAGAAAAASGPPAAAPPACRWIEAGESLQARVDAAQDGATLCLRDGVHRGPLRVRHPVVLQGSRGAVIRADGAGTTVRLEADGAALLGITVDGSGGRFDLLDAAVRVEADDVRIEGIAVRNALFGLLVEQSHRARIIGNEISGDPDQALGLRGDGIRLWEVRGSRIERNRLRDGRDVVVWYSPGNAIVDNTVENGRYGTHFMYSHDNEVTGNRYVGNVVGIFAMYSRGLQIRCNVLAESGGAAGVGLGAKESGNLEVVGNAFVGNTVGLYLDTSPLYRDEWNRYEHNVFALGEVAVVFHGSPERNSFLGNDFRSGAAPVRVEGSGDALGIEWRGNHFADYQGYDLDGDGTGDLPYELRSLSQQLTARRPLLAFFRGAPAMGLVEIVGRTVPLFQPATLLVDAEPRLQATAEVCARAG